jgi:hypothetical protein
MPDTVHEYYKEQEVLPTYGKFMKPEEMNEFERQRREMFTDKLFLPARLFKNAQLIEFGPDTGENSLVFAMWGADCTLIEPNPKAHPVIRDYFQRYNLTQKLKGLETQDILNYGKRGLPHGKFDLIDAEYSIYTVRPIKQWIEILAQLLQEDGLAIFLYMEAFGSFLELFMKVIHARVRQLTGLGAVETAQKVLDAKWNSIPHKRSLEAFVMDVLENPFTRLAYLMEPQSLCNEMFAVGMDLYSSWPPYKDGLRVEWVRKPLSPEEALKSEMDFISRSRLSHLTGIPCFMKQSDAGLEENLIELIRFTDDLIDGYDANKSARCITCLDKILHMLESGVVIGETRQEQQAQELITSIKNAFTLLGSENPDDLTSYTNHDPAFIQNWGSPANATVFRRRPAAA